MNTNIDPKWQAQLRKGYLELCVLIVLRQKQSSYGFEILQLLTNAGLDINEGTLYPLLNRMHKNGWLDSTWEPPAESGHPRRFYQLSEEGSAQLPNMLSLYKNNMEIIELLEELS
ncbi:MAG: PadR family transcriptional regulator [Thiolinea sp.]